jgi:hypothetical protein
MLQCSRALRCSPGSLPCVSSPGCLPKVPSPGPLPRVPSPGSLPEGPFSWVSTRRSFSWVSTPGSPLQGLHSRVSSPGSLLLGHFSWVSACFLLRLAPPARVWVPPITSAFILLTARVRSRAPRHQHYDYSTATCASWPVGCCGSYGVPESSAFGSRLALHLQPERLGLFSPQLSTPDALLSEHSFSLLFSRHETSSLLSRVSDCPRFPRVLDSLSRPET